MDWGEVAAAVKAATPVASSFVTWYIARLRYYTNWVKTMDARLTSTQNTIGDLDKKLQEERARTDEQQERAHRAELQVEKIKEQLATSRRHVCYLKNALEAMKKDVH